MGTNSKIEWTEKTWNPLVGCTRISPGCQHCYAETMSMRLANMARTSPSTAGRKKHYLKVINDHNRWNHRIALVPEALGDPLKWKTPTFVFVNSMSDLFHKEVPLACIQQVFEVMQQANLHQFQILTKRSERLLELDQQLQWARNIWMGVSVENTDYRCRIDDLRKTHAKIKFLSLEPLLGPLPRLNLRGIDWVIVGGESGPGARPMAKEWATDLRDQCVSKGVPFFFKQWGGVNKKAAGRLLDGRVWDEMPTEFHAHVPDPSRQPAARGATPLMAAPGSAMHQ